jgi:membrane protein
VQFQDALRELLPVEAYQMVADQIARIQKQPPVGLLSIGLAVSVYLASAVFQVVVAEMNRIYRVRETRPIWRRYLLAVTMTVVEATILIGGLLAIVIGGPLTRWLGLNEAQAFLAIASQWVGVVVLVLLSFALVFYFAPNARQRWEWITPGSVVGTVAFIIASLLFRLVAQHLSNYEKTYGALGGVMAMLFWLWLMGLILLVAAELNAVIRSADCAREPALCSDSSAPKSPSDLPHTPETPPPSRVGRVTSRSPHS